MMCMCILFSVDQNKYFDVLTVGKTGTGKSTLAREILGINSVLPSSSSITSSTPSTAAYYGNELYLITKTCV